MVEKRIGLWKAGCSEKLYVTPTAKPDSVRFICRNNHWISHAGLLTGRKCGSADEQTGQKDYFLLRELLWVGCAIKLLFNFRKNKWYRYAQRKHVKNIITFAKYSIVCWKVHIYIKIRWSYFRDWTLGSHGGHLIQWFNLPKARTSAVRSPLLSGVVFFFMVFPRHANTSASHARYKSVWVMAWLQRLLILLCWAIDVLILEWWSKPSRHDIQPKGLQDAINL